MNIRRSSNSDQEARNILKQLSSSKESPMRKMREKTERVRDPPSKPQKLVRRRPHLRKPYQEKFLNMAEARREIVNALKIHRASIKFKNQSNSFPAAVSPAPPPSNLSENLDFILPNQTLGLNLNLEHFVAIPNSSIYSTSSSPPTAEFDKTMDEDLANSPFDQVMEFPAWLNENEICSQHVNDFANFQHPVLPRMEIEGIEGMDGDWLA